MQLSKKIVRLLVCFAVNLLSKIINFAYSAEA